MPRARTFVIEEMGSLGAQLSFVPAESARRQFECLRKVLSEVRPDGLYRVHDIEYRITQFRREQRSKQADVQAVGSSLVRDLHELALRLTARAPLSPAEAWTLRQLAAHWRVSTRSLHRWRARGLLCAWVLQSAPRAGAHARVLGVLRDDALAFATAHRALLARASTFSVMDANTRQRILAEAGALARAGERRISRAAAAIASRVGRSSESVRGLLHAHPSASSGLLVGRRKERSGAQAVALRWFMRGEGASRIARRLGCSRAAADRLIQRARCESLTDASHLLMPASAVIPSTFARADASEVLLAPDGVWSNLLSAAPLVPTHHWLQLKPAAMPPVARVARECQRMMAVRYLMWSAQHEIGRLTKPRPTERALDQIETKLRFARLILRALMADLMPTVVNRLTVWSGVDPTRWGSRDVSRVLQLAAQTLRDVLFDADPLQLASQRVKLPRAFALALDRRLISAQRPSSPATRQGDTRVAMREPLDLLCPWQRHADALARRVARLERGSVEESLWHMRLGWDGNPPQSLANMARALRKPVGVVARQLGRAIAPADGGE